MSHAIIGIARRRSMGLLYHLTLDAFRTVEWIERRQNLAKLELLK
jgi:hypothetical protein